MKKVFILIIIFLLIVILPLINSNILIKKSNQSAIILTKNMVGLLKINNTNFVSKIMQYSDNTYFLNHDETLTKSIFGSIFLDYRNNLNDQKIIIYGHNSKTLNNAPFHFLENFLDYDFSNSHRYLTIETPEFTNKYKLFSVIITNGNFEHMNLKWDSNSYQEHLKYLQTSSLYNFKIDLDSNSDILILQTCNYKPESSYLLLSYKKEI